MDVTIKYTLNNNHYYWNETDYLEYYNEVK